LTRGNDATLKRMLERCQTRNAQLRKALEVNQLLSKELQLGVLLRRIMGTVQRLMQAEACTLFLLDDRTGDLVFQVALGEVGDKLKEIHRVPKGRGVAGWVAAHGRPARIPDAYADARFDPSYDERTGFRTRNMLCVPVYYRETLIGVCQVINRVDGDFGDDDLRLLETLAQMAAVAIENARVHQQLLKRSLLDRDLQLAHRLQQSFLPQSPPRVAGYACAFANRPAFEVGGDFYDTFPLPDGRIAYALGDVSGKGVAAALMMSGLLKDLRQEAMHGGSAGDVLSRINRGLAAGDHQGMFASAILLLLDPGSGRVTMANAGHPPPAHRLGGGVRFGHAASGPPLGIAPASRYTTQETTLAPGETVLLYSDGITEAKNPAGELAGETRLRAWLAAAPAEAKGCLAHVLACVRDFARDTPQSDDITLLALHRRADA